MNRRRTIIYGAASAALITGMLIFLSPLPPEPPKRKTTPRTPLPSSPRPHRTDGELAEAALKRSDLPGITRNDIERWWARVGKTPDTIALASRLLNDQSILPPRPSDGIEDPRLILARYAFSLKDTQSPEKRRQAIAELASLSDSFRLSDPDNLQGFVLGAHAKFLSEGFVATLNSLITDLPDNDQDYSDEARKLTRDFLTHEMSLPPVDAFLKSGQSYGPGDTLSACIAQGSRHFEQFRNSEPPPELARQAASLLRVVDASDTISDINSRLSTLSSESILLLTFPPNLQIEPYLSTTLEEYRNANAEEKNRFETYSSAIRRVLLDGSANDQQLLLHAINEQGEVQAATALFADGGPLMGYIPKQSP